MKRQALVILTTLSLLVALTAASVRAQSDIRVDVNVPFEFVIGTKTLPAGAYTLIYKQANMIQIQGRHGVSMLFPTVVVEAKKTQNELIFKRYGNQVFLSTLWMEGDDAGRAVKMSHTERELIRARRGGDNGSPEPEIVSLKLEGKKR